MKFGDIQLLSGSSIYNLTVEELSADPTFVDTDISRIYYNTTTNSYRFNNGTEYVDLSLPNNFMALVDTLGTNWVNADFTFNPTAFNALHNVTGLTSNSTLFNVIEQLDLAIYNVDAPALTGLQDVTIPENITTGYLLYYNVDGEYTFTDINTIITNYGELEVGSLKNVNNTPVDGGSLVYSAEETQYNIVNTSIVIQDFFNVTDHTISHNTGVKYVAVTVVNAQTDTIINDAVIQYVDEDSFNITLSGAAPVLVIVTVPYGFESITT